jgi:uncharacterized protein with NAD-binding domain and iron-sulfur cluster
VKRRIAILGGGIAGLSAAYQLSKTKELRASYSVTIYQMGWRLGGKCASGRNAEDRIEEHGLHVWFGCYENAFRMLRDVYSAWRREPENPLRDWTDAIKPHRFTPLGDSKDGKFCWWNLNWPEYPGMPGDGAPFPTGFALVKELLGLIEGLIHGDANLGACDVKDRKVVDDALALYDLAGAPSPSTTSPGKGPLSATIGELASRARLLAESATQKIDGMERSAVALFGLLRILGDRIVSADVDKPVDLMLVETVAVGFALARGIIADILLGSEARRRCLSNIEFRAWLIAHDASHQHVWHSTVLRCLYDTAMQYLDGDCTCPNMAAITGIIVSVRFLCTTKGSMLWRLQTGMGEAVIAPIYEVLRDRGVSVEFFRRVEDIEVSKGGLSVTKVRVARQVRTHSGDYNPLGTLLGREKVRGIRYWPAEPFWDQIDNGNELQKREVNFESHWCSEPPAGFDILEVGKNFDAVVLAISVGEFKLMNSDRSLAQAILDTDPGFLKMTQDINLIPTQSFQFWCARDLRGLGWQKSSPASVGWPPAFNIWADMTQTLAHEPAGPASVQYFCGPYRTRLYAQPRGYQTVPGVAQREVLSQAIAWFSNHGPDFLPGTATAGKKIDWNFLYVTDGSSGQSRLNRQFFRANVDPTECIPGSVAGSINSRIAAGGARAKNLFVAGCWTRTGFEVSCVEGAVMAGMQAARAISGSPREIFGENIFELRPKDSDA